MSDGSVRRRLASLKLDAADGAIQNLLLDPLDGRHRTLTTPSAMPVLKGLLDRMGSVSPSSAYGRFGRVQHAPMSLALGGSSGDRLGPPFGRRSSEPTRRPLHAVCPGLSQASFVTRRANVNGRQARLAFARLVVSAAPARDPIRQSRLASPSPAPPGRPRPRSSRERRPAEKEEPSVLLAFLRHRGTANEGHSHSEKA